MSHFHPVVKTGWFPQIRKFMMKNLVVRRFYDITIVYSEIDKDHSQKIIIDNTKAMVIAIDVYLPILIDS